MRSSSFLFACVALPIALASPASEYQTVLSELGGFEHLSESLHNSFTHAAEQAKKVLKDSQEKVDTWITGGQKFVKQNGLVYELVTLPTFPDHQLRVTDPDICDPKVKQHSGYLDISDGKHLFFWFFESRTSPKSAPVTLWLNGGPGCSSMAGLLFENGPCQIADDGKNVTYNKHSWNSHSNMIFLDQPVNVGYSYSSDGSTVNNTPVAAEDVYAFLELFFSKYPEYADAPFHVAAESYGGTYAPHIASVIHAKNTKLKATANAPTPRPKHINLASIILANGLTEPRTQFGTIPDYVCNGPFPVYAPDGAECAALRTKVPTCQRLIQSCYDFNSRWTCVPALAYCNSQLMGPLQQTGLNLYDVRKKCDRSKDGDLCYRQMSWVETYLNKPDIKKTLGVPSEVEFQSCNIGINQAFFGQGDGAKNSAILIPSLIEDGIRMLVYAGNADAMCNYIGNEAWVSNLEHTFHEEFSKAKPIPWVTLDSGKIAGEVRSAGGDGFTAGNVTFVQVYDAGHMVPYDQPEAAQDLFTRWILDVPLTLNATAAASVLHIPFGGF
ncbi:Alpha/Beta hydrolase protein [Cristinia sonorae]|uniref:Carboxypeptidase n=1 Tax=Cristinia sonorae TaxID=1940300 RepID=A0A8K0UJL4_9AGAR|nr:Alpha/Beta hydrolase protein [Cristinia sonorae]